VAIARRGNRLHRRRDADVRGTSGIQTLYFLNNTLINDYISSSD